MKDLFENWREFVDEETDVFAQQLINEGLLDVIKDKAKSAAALKNKAYDQALRQFISISGKITDKTVPLKTAVQKYLPKPVQLAAVAAIGLAVASSGKPILAQRVVSGTASVTDVLAALSGVMAEEEDETPA